MKRALIYLDTHAFPDSIALLEVVEQMYGIDGCITYAMSLDPSKTDARGVVNVLLQIESGRIENYDICNIARCIEELNQLYRFDVIVVPATTFGRMLAPRVAMRLKVGLVADVTEIRHRNGDLQLIRPAFSGRMLAAIVNQGPSPLMLSVRPNTFHRSRKVSIDTEVREVGPMNVRPPAVRLVERHPKMESQDIRKTEVLVSGGGGMLRGFDKLEGLAKALGGMVAASRRAVDGGKATRHIQVGQSGKTVSPRLYIAVGISGSIQHVAGIKGAEYIISVNSNRNAPICSLSDIVVEGDGRVFVDRMIEKIAGPAGTPRHTGL